MNKIATIAFAGAIGIIGLACGWTAPAMAQAAVDYKPGELVPAVMPTDQRGGFVADAYGDLLGRDTSGGENGLIGLLNQENSGRKAGELVPAVTPANQREGNGRGDFVASLYGDVLGRDTSGGENGLIGLLNQENSGRKAGELVPAVMPTDQLPAVQKTGLLGSLASIGSLGDLFPLSRGDNGGMLLPAVQKVRQATTGGNTEVAGPHVNPGVVKGLNFSNQGGSASGGNNTTGGGANAGSPKGIVLVKTTR